VTDKKIDDAQRPHADEHTLQSPPSSRNLDTFEVGSRLAASALWKDRFFLLIPIIILAIPSMIRGNRLQPLGFTSLLLNLVELVLEAGFLYFATVHLVQRFCETALPLSLETFKRLLGYTIAGRLLLLLPLLPFSTQSGGGTNGLEFLWLLLGVAVLGLVYAFFFCFLPIVLGSSKPKEILSEAYSLVSVSRTLPFRIVFYPWVIFFLFMGCASALDPQFQSNSVLFFLNIGHGLHRVIFIYLAICSALAAANVLQKVTISLGSIPQTSAKLTKQIPPQWSAPSWIINLFSSKTSGLLLISAICFLAIGTFRLQTAPLESKVVDMVSAIQDGKITLNVTLQQKSETPSRMSPSFFALKTSKGATLSKMPQKLIEINKEQNKEYDVHFPLMISGNTQLQLEFSTDRTVEQTKKLTDLYLWYHDNKVHEIDLTQKP
jgi:hypothetical protein